MYAEFHPEAERELIEHALYYEQRATDLGARFLDEVEYCISLLLSQPLLGYPLDDELRGFPLKNFPFTPIYHATSDHLYIVAVSHQRRRPGYWKNRIGQ
jgi:plasmid stabilization system protein ParE